MNKERKNVTDNIFANYKQESVMFIVDKEATKLLSNPIYRPILLILREGIKTAEEIQDIISTKEEYKEMGTSSLKTIYRHLKALTSAGLVVEAGIRKIDRSEEEKTPVTQRLFSRTAKFFYLSGSEKSHLSPEKSKVRAKLLQELIAIGHNVAKPNIDCLIELISKITSCQVESGSNLFKEYPDELVEIVGDVELKDFESVLYIYSAIVLLLRKSEFEKDLKNCLGIS